MVAAHRARADSDDSLSLHRRRVRSSQRQHGRTRSGLTLKLHRDHPGEASGSPITSSARERATATDSART
jgi:hypothetical protein